MTFAWWMLVLGACLLFAVVAIYVANISAQVGDYSIQPMQRYDLTLSNTGGGALRDRWIDVGNKGAPPKAHVPAHALPESWLSTSPPTQTTAGADVAPNKTGVRQIRVNGQLVYDGEAVSKVTLRISRAGRVEKMTPTFTTPINSGVPMRGLVIMAEPLEKILNGRKTLELRKKNNKMRGPIALIQKGSGKIVGVANIGECIGPMTYSDFAARTHEHGVEASRLRSVFDEGYTIGWKLSDARRLKTPVAYTHKPGAVTWVTLDEADRASLGSALDLV